MNIFKLCLWIENQEIISPLPIIPIRMELQLWNILYRIGGISGSDFRRWRLEVENLSSLPSVGRRWIYAKILIKTAPGLFSGISIVRIIKNGFSSRLDWFTLKISYSIIFPLWINHEIGLSIDGKNLWQCRTVFNKNILEFALVLSDSLSLFLLSRKYQLLSSILSRKSELQNVKLT